MRAKPVHVHKVFAGHLYLKTNPWESCLKKFVRHPSSNGKYVWNSNASGNRRHIYNARCKQLCVLAVYLWLDHLRWLLISGMNRAMTTCHTIAVILFKFTPSAFVCYAMCCCFLFLLFFKLSLAITLAITLVFTLSCSPVQTSLVWLFLPCWLCSPFTKS